MNPAAFLLGVALGVVLSRLCWDFWTQPGLAEGYS